ncbi:yippee zinc-binding/DNA-binding /Mis18, centromere assembly-domain-containing protein [Lipomyces japonicus]|uniref:yippee zinc-binding/DNA-binding /Mis18, centromere assembly-domain-containing protein n=1 Tax=Lipomyces japonicus TaxID=56871 RepID=UPI0034D00C8E
MNGTSSSRKLVLSFLTPSWKHPISIDTDADDQSSSRPVVAGSSNQKLGLRVETLFSPSLSIPITIFKCRKCQAHIAYYEHVVSKAFHGRQGRGVLISDVVNVNLGMPTERMLTTGMHCVADLLCASCKVCVGWKYITASESMQKYKVGKYILELKRIVKETVSVHGDDEDYLVKEQIGKLDAKISRPNLSAFSSSLPVSHILSKSSAPSSPGQMEYGFRRAGNRNSIIRNLLDDQLSFVEEFEEARNEVTA